MQRTRALISGSAAAAVCLTSLWAVQYKLLVSLLQGSTAPYLIFLTKTAATFVLCCYVYKWLSGAGRHFTCGAASMLILGYPGVIELLGRGFPTMFFSLFGIFSTAGSASGQSWAELLAQTYAAPFLAGLSGSFALSRLSVVWTAISVLPEKTIASISSALDFLKSTRFLLSPAEDFPSTRPLNNLLNIILILIAILTAAFLPIIELEVETARNPLSEASVWGKAWLPVSIAASAFIFGPLISIALITLKFIIMRSIRRFAISRSETSGGSDH